MATQHLKLLTLMDLELFTRQYLLKRWLPTSTLLLLIGLETHGQSVANTISAIPSAMELALVPMVLCTTMTGSVRKAKVPKASVGELFQDLFTSSNL